MNPRLTLAERCRIHASKMDGEGYYGTANVLSDAADCVEQRHNLLSEIMKAWAAIHENLGIETRCEGDDAARTWNKLCGLMREAEAALAAAQPLHAPLMGSP